MLNFGTSAYLKILALNPKPRNTELRKRLSHAGKGYDFHKAMRRIAVGHASDALTSAEVEAKINGISRPPERTAAKVAIGNLFSWLGSSRVREVRNSELRADSPLGLFSVKFSPDFEIDYEGKPVRIHLWNTAKPPIKLREAIGTMGLFAQDDDDYSLGILSLRTQELFVLKDVETSRQLSLLLARDIDRRIGLIRDETDRPSHDDRPARRDIM